MSDDKKYNRLSDRILPALQLAIEQKDLAIFDLLRRALEMSMTRGAGGADFIERRAFSDEVERMIKGFNTLKKESTGQN